MPYGHRGGKPVFVQYLSASTPCALIKDNLSSMTFLREVGDICTTGDGNLNHCGDQRQQDWRDLGIASGCVFEYAICNVLSTVVCRERFEGGPPLDTD